MQNNIIITMGSQQPQTNNICENNSASINFSISLSQEALTHLQDEIKDTKTVDANIFINKLLNVLSEPECVYENVEPLTQLESAVTTLMNELGIPAHTKGYRYLRDAIVLSTENPDLIGQVTKTLYPTIAQSHNTTPVRVERVIRHAIEYCCSKGNSDTVNAYFSQCLASPRGKPTNSEFIAIISDKMRMKA